MSALEVPALEMGEEWMGSVPKLAVMSVVFPGIGAGALFKSIQLGCEVDNATARRAE